MRTRISTAALLAVVLISSAAPAQTDPAIEAHIKQVQDALLPPVLVKGETPKTTKLADRMAELHVPGVSVAVIHGGKLDWARGFGVVAEGGAAVTADTLFQAGSVSKPVAALAALHLADSGKLDLDADVNGYLKSWKIPANKFTDGQKVTIRELVSHTAGMTVHGFPGYASGAPLPTLQQILDGETPANTPAIRVDTTPDSQWRYSGGGYVVLTQLLQDVTGKPLAELLQETVLGPMGMAHSSYQQPLPPDKLALAAMPYNVDGKPIEGGPHVYPEIAPDGLWTTPSDLARYAIEIQHSLAGQSTLVLSTAMTRQMLTPGRNNWGLGLELGGSEGHRYFAHSGSNEGYKADLVAFEDGEGVVVMTSGDAGYELALEIRRTVARDYGWPDFQPAEHAVAKIRAALLDRFVGTYQKEEGITTTITRRKDRYFVQGSEEAPMEIFPENDHAFFLKAAPSRFIFDNGSQLTLRRSGTDDVLMKRLDADAAKRVERRLAARNKRAQTQTRAPGSEEALRRHLQEFLQGTPDYARMSRSLAEIVRQNLDPIRTDMMSFGAISSIVFERVDPNGADVYTVRFAHGGWKVWIEVGPDKKTYNLGLRKI